MAKVQTPTPATPAIETPTVDYSQLLTSLASPLGVVMNAESQSKSGILDAVIAIREFREENPTADRGDVKTTVQQAVADMLGVKLVKVQNSKGNGGDDYAYTLSSQMLNTAWPKGEKEEKKVAKAISDGKGWVEVRRASSKPQSKPARDPNANKITMGNFAAKLNIFLTQAQVDTGLNMSEILRMAEMSVDAIRSAPPGV